MSRLEGEALNGLDCFRLGEGRETEVIVCATRQILKLILPSADERACQLTQSSLLWMTSSAHCGVNRVTAESIVRCQITPASGGAEAEEKGSIACCACFRRRQRS